LKPYFQSEALTLYHADCVALDVEYDLLVTDPPYGQQFESGFTDMWGAITGDDDVDGIHARLAHVLRGLKRWRHAYIFGDRLDLAKLPRMGSATDLIWDKGMIGPGDLSLPWGPQHERITFGVHVPDRANREKGRGALSARLRKGSVLRSLRPNSGAVKHHPTEKPIDILRQMIESSSLFGEVIYDPFAGSCSTLIAAALEGRKAIGCEIEERYCENAVRRFESELRGLTA
jgi:DNA modification methylase